MPIFTFKCVCVDCANLQESFQKFDDPPPPCEKCGEKTERVITGTKLKFNEPWRPTGKRIY